MCFEKGEGGACWVKKVKKGEMPPRSTAGDGAAESGHETKDNERTFLDKLPTSL